MQCSSEAQIYFFISYFFLYFRFNSLFSYFSPTCSLSAHITLHIQISNSSRNSCSHVTITVFNNKGSVAISYIIRSPSKTTKDDF